MEDVEGGEIWVEVDGIGVGLVDGASAVIVKGADGQYVHDHSLCTRIAGQAISDRARFFSWVNRCMPLIRRAIERSRLAGSPEVDDRDFSDDPFAFQRRWFGAINEPSTEVDIESIKRDFLGRPGRPSEPEDGPELVVVMGEVASGKTTHRRSRLASYVPIDPGDIYQMLTIRDTKVPANIGRLLQEVGRAVALAALRDRRSVVLEILPGRQAFRYLMAVLPLVEALGYRTSVVTCEAPYEVRLERSRRRAEREISALGTEMDAIEWLSYALCELELALPTALSAGHRAEAGVARPASAAYSLPPVDLLDLPRGTSTARDGAGCPRSAPRPVRTPNAACQTVLLGELVSDETFRKSPMTLPLALGRTGDGNVPYADLAKMPHLLIAGDAGSGKTVALHAILVSLLCRATPDEVRLILVDPKGSELGSFDGIPHLLSPIVTEADKAVLALEWAVDEMERRYQLFAELHVRDIKSFNAKIDQIRRREAAPPARDEVNQVARDPKPTPNPEDSDRTRPEIPDRLPQVVLVVDELADLMIAAATDVDTAVVRIGQKARAAGIHLIFATQRPSADVVTSDIKCSFPARIALRLSSKADSQTLLGDAGAERLLGKGDMLLLSTGASSPVRVHGAFVSEDEANRITDFWRKHSSPVYEDAILQAHEPDREDVPEDDAQDELCDRAVNLVTATRRASTAWLQRKLGIGYNRAAKLMERMEKQGVVGPPRNPSDREILVDP